jgi:hypothetical protein
LWRIFEWKEKWKRDIFFFDGVIYSGEYREGKRNGKGMVFYPDDNIYSGLYENDKEYGSGRIYHLNGCIQDNYTLLDPSNSVSDIIINEGISADVRVIFERENMILKLINDFFVTNCEILDILDKILSENMNDTINLRNIFKNMYLEEIIFNLLSDINELVKS